MDITEITELVEKHQPKLVIIGFSAYSGEVSEEFMEQVRGVAHANGAYFMFDMAHIAGLVAGGQVPNPVKYADVVTSTTHKTLRGPRGGLILWNDSTLTGKINSAVFPGTQGGPLMHVIAAKAQCFIEAGADDFKDYAKEVMQNAKDMVEVFKWHGIHVVGGTTHNHMMLLDVGALGMTGAEAEKLLGENGIIVNKNTIPNDPRPPMVTSGIRIGTPAITTKGLHAKLIAKLVSRILLKAE